MNLPQKQPKLAIQPIQFIDLKAQQDLIRPQIDAAIKRVLEHGKYIMGPEVFEFEERLTEFCDSKHAITCSSGTDALLMILMAQGIGPGDAVFIPSFTFTATPEVVALLGATPIFVDVLEDTYNIDPESIKRGLQVAKDLRLNSKAIIAVDLFGQPADYDQLEVIAEENNLWILADAAQSFGAMYKNKKVGQLGFATATSFFPAKPLGCYGDGGCILTDDDVFAEKLKSIRVHGQGVDKYDNVRIGLNGRLDTMQAAILIEKLKLFPGELSARQRIADKYNESLEGQFKTPDLIESVTSSWAQYTICAGKNTDRDELIRGLKERGVPAAIYYPKPLHKQQAYKDFPKAGELFVCEALSSKVFSLPMSGYVREEDQKKVIEVIHELV